jgi:phage terminase large subunit
MPTIDLRNVPSRINPKFLPLIEDQHRVHVLIGGASSGKSYDTGIKVVYKMLAEPGHKYLVIRKVGATLRHSVYDLIVEIIDAWGMRPLFDVRLGDMSITCNANGNKILFSGLDDVEKLKSVQSVTDIWVEEASEITEGDFNQIDLRIRGKTAYHKQITLTLNPISALHWIKHRFFDREEPNTLTHHSTYKDNIFLDQETKVRLEQIKDPYYYDVYVLGKWGVYGNVVFNNYVIEDFDYTEEDFENVCTGMDFGFAHASAIERIGFKDGELYSFDEVHAKGLTNPVLIERAKEHFGDELYNMVITADSAEPARIQEWRDAGITVLPAKKGKDSVRFGVDYLSRVTWHIHASRCINLAREVQSFKRREDKDGNALDDFVEINDDGIAACRYATEWIWGQAHGVVETAVTAGDFGF